MVKRILITGASGLIGGILVEHLSKNTSYEIYGIDRHAALSLRYQLENTLISGEQQQQPKLPSKEKFFICDINDKDQLSRIIAETKANIIIHLAGVLETETVETIKRVNCDGTKTLFDAAAQHDHVEMIIYASSVMVNFGYLDNEPYSSLLKNIRPKEELPKITVDDPPMPSILSPPFEAYCRSKMYGEQLAKDYSAKDDMNIKFICARLGWINTTDDIVSDAYDWSDKSVWCSYRDLCQFFDRVLENQSKLNKFQTYFVSSNNDCCW